MTLEYTLTPDQLSNAIDNTIRVFDEYNLRKKKDSEGRQFIMDTSWMGMFSYYIVETPAGAQLTLEAVAAKTITAEERLEYEERFLKNLFKIIDKEIAVTPEIANRDLYKKPKIGLGLRSILWLVVIIVLVIKTIQGCMKH
jgi:hypothetical protein